MDFIKKILLESKQVGILYHFTTIQAIVRIIEQNKLRSEQILKFDTVLYKIKGFNKGVSLTRDKLFQKTGNRSTISGTAIRITLNGNKLSNKYKIVPFNFYNFKSESEELLLTEKGIIPVIPYIEQIDVLELKTNEIEDLDELIKLCKENNIFIQSELGFDFSEIDDYLNEFN